MRLGCRVILSALFVLLSFFSSCKDKKKRDEPRTKNKEFVFVEFAESLGVNRCGERYFVEHHLDARRYHMAKEMWDRQKSVLEKKEKVANQEKERRPPRIPKILHFVWLRREPIPYFFRCYAKSWQMLHSEWECKTWDLQSLSQFSSELQNEIKAITDVYQKETFLRAILLERFGGLCVDYEFECLKPFDCLHEEYDLYTAMEPPLLNQQLDRVLHVGVGFMGARAGHPIIKKWLEEMRLRLSCTTLQFESQGEKKYWVVYGSFGDVLDENFCEASRKNIILPPTYVYPISPRWIETFHKINPKKKQGSSNKVVEKILKLQQVPLFSTIGQEAMAIHHTGGAWAKVQSFPLQQQEKASQTLQ